MPGVVSLYTRRNKFLALAVRDATFATPYARYIRGGVKAFQTINQMRRNRGIRRAVAGVTRGVSRYGKRVSRKKQQQRARARKIGHARGQGTTKTSIQKPPTVQSLATRVLHIEPCLTIEHSLSNQTNRRQRNMVFVKGIKLCMQLQNKLQAFLTNKQTNKHISN